MLGRVFSHLRILTSNSCELQTKERKKRPFQAFHIFLEQQNPLIDVFIRIQEVFVEVLFWSLRAVGFERFMMCLMSSTLIV